MFEVSTTSSQSVCDRRSIYNIVTENTAVDMRGSSTLERGNTIILLLFDNSCVPYTKDDKWFISSTNLFPYRLPKVGNCLFYLNLN